MDHEFYMTRLSMTLLPMYVFLVTYFPPVMYCIPLHMYSLPQFKFHFIQTSTAFICGPGYLSPLVVKLSTAALIPASSSAVNTTSRDAQFSSRRGIVFVPGIGMMSSPCAATQASASCAGVIFFLAAMAVNLSTIFQWYINQSDTETL